MNKAEFEKFKTELQHLLTVHGDAIRDRFDMHETERLCEEFDVTLERFLKYWGKNE